MTPPPTGSILRRYSASVALAAAAVFLRLLLTHWLDTKLPYFAVLPAVLITCRFWGIGPAIFATVLATAGTSAATGDRDWQRILLLLVAATISIWVIQALRRAHALAAESASLALKRLQISARLQAVVESSRDAIISTGLDGIIQSWNAGAEQVFGYSAAEALGRPIAILMRPDSEEDESDILDRVRTGGPVKHFETIRCRKDGKLIHVSVTISPVLDDRHNNTIGASQIARDITEQKELQEQLRQSQKLESLGVLAGGLAHDFNNLLTGIMGNASLVQERLGEDDPARVRIDEVLQASERAALLVRQMTAYAGKGRFILEPVDVSAQVAEILPLVHPSMSRLVELDLVLDEHLPLVAADRTQIQHLITNLLVNAAEAIGNREGVISIRTFTRLDGNKSEVVLEVQDTGCGMDAATQARAFDPFFTTKFPGRGLGLSAVMGIIRSHQGKIGVVSTPGKGTTFTAAFPAAMPTERDLASPDDLHGTGKVLVVDDEELVRNMARFTLERHGYTVETAPDGKAAVQKFAAHPDEFQAILLDLTMPVMDGEEAMDQIRKIRADIPVVLSSGFREADAASRFMGRGLAGFLQKPYTATALARRIRDAVSAPRNRGTGAPSPSGGGS